MSPKEAIAKAIKLSGSGRKLAAAVGYSQHGVWRAKQAGRCSGDLAIKIELATNGEVEARHLAPHLYEPFKPRRRRKSA